MKMVRSVWIASFVAITFSCWAFPVPTVSIITSLYKGGIHIEGFLVDMVQQTIFNDCELIIVDANSPERESVIVKKYMDMFPNIRYVRLDKTVSIYQAWNIAIEMAQGEFLTNANVDDRLAYNCYEIHLKALQERPDIDLVYSDCLITHVPNQTFEVNTADAILNRPPYSFEELKRQCLPNNHPMWRRSMHDDYGLFDPVFKIAGDWEMWLRAASQGAEFLKVDQILSLYYDNPSGLSTNSGGNWREEFLIVYNTYHHDSRRDWQ